MRYLDWTADERIQFVILIRKFIETLFSKLLTLTLHDYFEQNDVFT